MVLRFVWRSSFEYRVHPVEDKFVDQGRVNALKSFLGALDTDQPNVKSIVQDRRETVARNPSAGLSITHI
jgi:hypothetical protein